MQNRLATMMVFFVACSTPETPPVGTKDSGPAVPSDASTSSDAAPADAAPSDAAPADAGAPSSGNVGGVFAISDSVLVDGGVRGSHRAGAFFVHRTGEDTTTIARTVGPCLVEKLGGGKAPEERDVSAGAVHVTGGAKTIDLVPSAKGTYAAISGNDSLWIGGEPLTVTADGKDVPAFTVRLVAPSKVTLTAPALPAARSSLEVTRQMPFLATWRPAASGEVVLYFDIATGASAYSATCNFKASAGVGEVPASAFSDFPAGDGTFNFYAKEASAVAPVDWSVRFTASSAMVGADDRRAEGTATFR